ncbi:MAG: hypothetical protein K940chlam5_00182 [Candidatus Anoxychlamydiales bacterium]|nr:hypothetical protein [Candidatus Anoxychlamydiales bacterium]
MNEKILNRICNKAKIPDLLDTLVDKLTLPDLQSLLLEVYKRKTKKLTPKYLVDQYKQNRFVCPSKADVKKTLEFDTRAFSILPNDFEILDLSPIAPLGCSSIIASVDQNNALSTIRGSEVCSDTTNVLALESAQKRQVYLKENNHSTQRIKLSTSQKVVRCQVWKEASSFSNFRLFAMTTAGRDKGSFTFEIESLSEHLSYYITLLTQIAKIGIKAHDISVHITVLDENRLDIVKKMLNKLQQENKEASLLLDQERESGRGYYKDVCFQIFAKNSSNENLMLVDGGFTDWTAKLLSNKKERFLISGLGSERLIACFK